MSCRKSYGICGRISARARGSKVFFRLFLSCTEDFRKAQQKFRNGLKTLKSVTKFSQNYRNLQAHTQPIQNSSDSSVSTISICFCSSFLIWTNPLYRFARQRDSNQQLGASSHRMRLTSCCAENQVFPETRYRFIPISCRGTMRGNVRIS